jgi:hypothetical protein
MYETKQRTEVVRGSDANHKQPLSRCFEVRRKNRLMIAQLSLSTNSGVTKRRRRISTLVTGGRANVFSLNRFLPPPSARKLTDAR